MRPQVPTPKSRNLSFTEIVEDLEIEVSTFGRDSAALGKAALVFNGAFSVPDSSFLGDLS